MAERGWSSLQAEPPAGATQCPDPAHDHNIARPCNCCNSRRACKTSSTAWTRRACPGTPGSGAAKVWRMSFAAPPLVRRRPSLDQTCPYPNLPGDWSPATTCDACMPSTTACTPRVRLCRPWHAAARSPSRHPMPSITAPPPGAWRPTRWLSLGTARLTTWWPATGRVPTPY